MSEKNILEIKNLHVSADDKDILRGVDLTIGKNETHVLMGPNGTGKSNIVSSVTSPMMPSILSSRNGFPFSWK